MSLSCSTVRSRQPDAVKKQYRAEFKGIDDCRNSKDSRRSRVFEENPKRLHSVQITNVLCLSSSPLPLPSSSSSFGPLDRLASLSNVYRGRLLPGEGIMARYESQGYLRHVRQCGTMGRQSCPPPAAVAVHQGMATNLTSSAHFVSRRTARVRRSDGVLSSQSDMGSRISPHCRERVWLQPAILLCLPSRHPHFFFWRPSLRGHLLRHIRLCLVPKAAPSAARRRSRQARG